MQYVWMTNLPFTRTCPIWGCPIMSDEHFIAFDHTLVHALPYFIVISLFCRTKTTMLLLLLWNMYKQPHPKVGGLKWYMRTLVDHFYHIYDLKLSTLQPKALFSFEFNPLRLLIYENPFQALSTFIHLEKNFGNCVFLNWNKNNHRTKLSQFFQPKT